MFFESAYEGRKFILYNKKGLAYREGQILLSYGDKVFDVKSALLSGHQNLYYYKMSLKFMRERNVKWLGKYSRCHYRKIIHYDKNGNMLPQGKAYLSVNKMRVECTY